MTSQFIKKAVVLVTASRDIVMFRKAAIVDRIKFCFDDVLEPCPCLLGG